MQYRFTFLVLIVAVVASVFAIWPVVADAPWEEEAVIVVETEAPDPRCEAALIMKAEARVARAALPQGGGSFGINNFNESSSVSYARPRRELEEVIEQADRDIHRYC